MTPFLFLPFAGCGGAAGGVRSKYFETLTPWRAACQLVRFWYQNSKFCTLVQTISTMVLIFGTKVVLVTTLYHYTNVFPPMSVRVNYLKHTTVHKSVSHCNFTDVYH
jgi:hypothetical protein